MPLLNVTIPGGKRATLVDAALARLGRPAARHVAWLDVIDGRADLARLVRPGDVVRLDAPGRCADTELALLRRGGYDGPPPGHGQLVAQSAWYDGYAATLRQIAAQLAAAPPHRLVNDPAEVAAMCDKQRTHDLLAAAGVPTPTTRPVGSAADVWASEWPAAFVKLRHGSSGSGIVALRRGENRLSATTSVELSEGRLFNTRRLVTHRDPATVDRLLKHLVPMGCVIQPWLRKAGVASGTFDLRLVVCGGAVTHVVPRVSRSPITNLHLLNARGDTAAVRRSVGEAAWREAHDVAVAAAGVFPRTLHAGVDVAITTAGRASVIEVNAFGDLLPGLLDERGDDTHTAQLRHVFQRAVA